MERLAWFKFRYIYYYLPIFFLVLAVSPNFTAISIGISLVTMILILPIANYISAVISNRYKFHPIDLLAFILTGGLIYLGLTNTLTILILEVGFIISVLWVRSGLFEKETSTLLWMFPGALFFAMLFIGINQYSIASLLHSMLYIYLIGTSLYFVMIALMATGKGKFNFLVTLFLVFSMYFTVVIWVGFSLKYVFSFIILLIPVTILYYSVKPRNKQSGDRLRLTFTTGMLISMIYLFFDSTHVLEAVMAGY